MVDQNLEIADKRDLGYGLIDQSLGKKIKKIRARISRSESGDSE